jgi:hypothetical protein
MRYHSQEQGRVRRLKKSVLLQRHPVLVPLVLLVGSFLSCCVALLFPLFLGGSALTTLCLSLACVLGIAGLLTGITGILERVDRQPVRSTSVLTAMLSRLKE